MKIKCIFTKLLPSILLPGLYLFACKKEQLKTDEFNTNQLTIVEDFLPKQGAPRTDLFITDDHFNTNISGIQVCTADKSLNITERMETTGPLNRQMEVR